MTNADNAALATRWMVIQGAAQSIGVATLWTAARNAKDVRNALALMALMTLMALMALMALNKAE